MLLLTVDLFMGDSIFSFSFDTYLIIQVISLALKGGGGETHKGGLFS